MPPKRSTAPTAVPPTVTVEKVTVTAAQRPARKEAVSGKKTLNRQSAGKKKPKQSEPVAVASSAGAKTPQAAKTKKVAVAAQASRKKASTTRAAKSTGTVPRTRRGKGRAATEPFRVLVLSHLPPEFQEPEIIKFLSQFGTTVSSCYVVRTRQSNRSRGTAFVRFADTTTDGQYEAILDECHGMLLGENTVTARYRISHKPMPPKKVVDARRKLDWLGKTRGKKMVRYDVTNSNAGGTGTAASSWLERLKRCVVNERKTNALLRQIGVAYEFHGFEDQLTGSKDDAPPTPSPPVKSLANTAATITTQEASPISPQATRRKSTSRTSVKSPRVTKA